MFFFTVYFEQCTPEHSVPCNSALLLCAMIYAHCAAIYRENHENQKITKSEIKSRGSIACGPMRK